MEVVPNNTLLPGDPRLIEHIVCELKSQGIFDQFRKECIDDVDTKPAYQNLRQRVEGSVSGFLKTQAWRPDMNKNQLREMLRKNIYESGFLETGVERIVDQVVYPKINSVFLPQVEDVVYNFLGLEKPVRSVSSINGPLTINTVDLLPTDLDPISPDSEVMDKSLNKSDKSNDETDKLDDSKNDEFESPPFEPITEQSVFSAHEESSNDSHLSGISGLTSHDSNMSSQDCKVNIFSLDAANQDSQLSKVSSNSRLSIITTDSKHNSEKMDISSDDTQTSKCSKLGEESILEETPDKFENGGLSHFNIKPEMTHEIDAIRIDINEHQNGESEEQKNEDQYDVEMDIDEDSQMSNLEEPKTLEQEKTLEDDGNTEEMKKESLEKEMEELKMDVRVSNDSIQADLEKEFCEETKEVVSAEENSSKDIEENGSKSGLEDAKTEDSQDSVLKCDLKVEDTDLKKQESTDDASKLEGKKPESTDDSSKLDVKKSERSRHDSDRKHSSRYSESKDKKEERKFDKDRKEKERNRSTSGSKDKDKYRDKSKDNRSKDTSKSKDDKSAKSKEDKEKSSSKEDKSRSSSSSKYSRDRSNSKSDSKSSKDSKDRSDSRSKTNSKSNDKPKEETKVPKSDDTKKADSSKKTEESKKESDVKKSAKSEDSRSSSSSKAEENKSSRSRDRSRSDTKHTSSSSSRDRKSSSSKDHKDRKDVKKSSKRDKDDHSSSRDKKTDNRRSADRDSNDGSSGIGNNSNSNSSKEKESSSVKSSENSTDSSQGSNSGDSGQSDNSQTSQCLNQNDDSSTIKTPVTILTDTAQDKHEITISPSKDSDSDTAQQHVKIIKPKFASNIFEARRLMKVRKKLEKLEKKRQRQLVEGKTDGDCLSLEDTDSVDSGCLQIVEDLKEDLEMKNTTTDRLKDSLKDESNSNPTTSVVSKESWDALEAKLSLNVDYDSYIDENCDSSSSTKHPRRSSDEEDCLYFVQQRSPKIERYLKQVASLQRDGAQLAIVLEDCRKMAPPPHMNSDVPTKRARKTNQKYMIDEGESRETNTSKKTTGVDGKNSGTLKKKTKGRKRKLDGEMDGFYLDNNNKKTNHHFDVTDIVDDYEEVMEPSPSASNTSNGSIDLTTKIKPPARLKKAKKIQNETFPLPLSPESDVSASSIEVRNVAHEKDVTAPVKTPRASVKKSQRYSSDDLYKPRPFVSGSSRRQRGLLNSTDNVDPSAKLRR